MTLLEAVWGWPCSRSCGGLGLRAEARNGMCFRLGAPAEAFNLNALDRSKKSLQKTKFMSLAQHHQHMLCGREVHPQYLRWGGDANHLQGYPVKSAKKTPPGSFVLSLRGGAPPLQDGVWAASLHLVFPLAFCPQAQPGAGTLFPLSLDCFVPALSGRR